MESIVSLPLTGDRNQCQSCKQHFNSSFAFEKHRVGEFGLDRRCLTPAEMEAKGMSVNARGFWISSAMTRDFGTEPELGVAATVAAGAAGGKS